MLQDLSLESSGVLPLAAHCHSGSVSSLSLWVIAMHICCSFSQIDSFKNFFSSFQEGVNSWCLELSFSLSLVREFSLCLFPDLDFFEDFLEGYQGLL